MLLFSVFTQICPTPRPSLEPSRLSLVPFSNDLPSSLLSSVNFAFERYMSLHSSNLMRSATLLYSGSLARQAHTSEPSVSI